MDEAKAATNEFRVDFSDEEMGSFDLIALFLRWMRAILETGEIPYQNLITATLLNGVYLALAIVFFYYNLRVVKEKGLLIRRGTE